MAVSFFWRCVNPVSHQPKTLVPALCYFYDRRKFCDTAPPNPEPPGKTKQGGEKDCFVSLINTDKVMTFVKLSDAVKISERRRLRLVKLKDFDKKHQTPVYQLLTEAQVLDEDIKSKRSKKLKTSEHKNEKILSISDKISDHDLESKVKQILSWVSKNCEVRVTIKCSDPGEKRVDNIFKKLEEALNKKCKIVQKRNNNHDMKFQIIPLT